MTYIDFSKIDNPEDFARMARELSDHSKWEGLTVTIGDVSISHGALVDQMRDLLESKPETWREHKEVKSALEELGGRIRAQGNATGETSDKVETVVSHLLAPTVPFATTRPVGPTVVGLIISQLPEDDDFAGSIDSLRRASLGDSKMEKQINEAVVNWLNAHDPVSLQQLGIKDADAALAFIKQIGGDRIRFLNLSGLSLSITEAAKLGELLKLCPNLERLDLSHMGVSILPPEIGALTKLTDLNLSGNRLLYLPEEMGNPENNLRHLNLSNTALKSIPAVVFTLDHLTHLDMSSNRLEDIPAEIGNLKHLTRLDMSGNLLEDIPAEIGNLEHLTHLNMSLNWLEHIPAEIGDLEHLTRLDMSGNDLEDIPAEIGNLEHLTHLNIGGCGLTELPAEFGKLRGLTTLSLDHNDFTQVPGEIKDLVSLETLDLNGNDIEALPGWIPEMNKIENFNIRNNPLAPPPTHLGDRLWL